MIRSSLGALAVVSLSAASLAGCAASEDSSNAAPADCPKAAELDLVADSADDKVGKPVTIKGATGTATVSEVEPGEAPKFTFKDSPFTVTKTGVKVLSEGSGKVVPVGSKVTVNYYGVNGRDGNNFDSSYKRGKPVSFSLNEVVKGFSKAIQCQKIGTHLVVAMTPKDGYGANGNRRAGIKGTDTLLFYIEIKGVQ